MNEHDLMGFFEPERYELYEDGEPLWLDRRDFVRLVGGGLVVACLLADAEAQRFGGRGQGPRELSAWLHIAEDSAVTVYTGKVEVGQNIRTSLTQVVAEELAVPASGLMKISDKMSYEEAAGFPIYWLAYQASVRSKRTWS